MKDLRTKLLATILEHLKDHGFEAKLGHNSSGEETIETSNGLMISGMIAIDDTEYSNHDIASPEEAIEVIHNIIDEREE